MNIHSLKKYAKKLAILFVLAGLVLLFSLTARYFFSPENFSNIFLQQSYIIIATIGLAFVMISGGMDLSIGYQMSLVGVVTCIFMKYLNFPVPVAILIGLSLGVILGLFNGLMAIKLRVHSLIVSLGTMLIYQGVSYIASNQSVILNLPQSFKALGQGYVHIFIDIPISFLIMIGVALIASFILNKTYLGRYIYALGNNEEAAHLAGINTNRIRLIVFAMQGLFVAIAAMILFGRTGSAAANTGPGTEFSAMIAAVLGGISFKGGEGKVWGIITGVLILGVLSTGMQFIGLNTYAQFIVKGIVFLLAVGFDTYQKASASRVSKEVIENS